MTYHSIIEYFPGTATMRDLQLDWLRAFEHTKIIATHDLELVLEVCSRVIVLDAGRMVADGPAADLLNDEPLMLAHGLERPHSLRHRHPH